MLIGNKSSLYRKHCEPCLGVGWIAMVTRQDKEVKGIHIGKKEVKLFSFIDNMILNVENPKEHTD